MQNQSNLPKTFCPAKWDEIVLNAQHNYVYSCCKATPLVFVKDYKSLLSNQRNNLLNGVQDPSCNYCWNVENNNLPSRRHEYLKKFKIDTFEEYRNLEKSPENVEINLGNTCNMQCIYCNPKLSSQWENDVKQKTYPVFTDRHVYILSDKKDINETMTINLEILEKENPARVVMIGGEPLLNKYFWEIANRLHDIQLTISTNFNCDLSVIKKLLDLEKTNKLNLHLFVSLDCTFPISNYIRYNLNHDTFLNNLSYFINNAKTNQIGINSLMTCITILDIENFLNFLKLLSERFSNKPLMFNFHACVEPKVQSFSTIPDKTKQEILTFLKNYNNEIKANGLENIISHLETSTFNSGLHKQFKMFIQEWELRKKIVLPVNLKEKLCL